MSASQVRGQSRLVSFPRLRGGFQAKMKWAKAREKDLLRDILIFG